MPNPSNPKLGLPKVLGFGGRLFRRSHFLNGTLKTYFAPYQWPYMIGTLDPVFVGGSGAHYDVGVPATTDVYQNPTSWPEAGRLLRVPQVVWLETRIGSACDAQMQDPFVMHYLDLSFSDQYVVQPNLGRAEALRLAPIFAATKTAIEAIRPGRTYVKIANWCEEVDLTTFPYDAGLGSPTITQWKSVINGHAVSVNETIGFTTGAGFIECPARIDSYFGLDHLGIYCGDSVFQNIYLNLTTGSTNPVFPIDGNVVNSGVAGNPFWQAVYTGRLRPNLYKFRRHATRLFHSPSAYTIWTDPTGLGGVHTPDSNVNNAGFRLWALSNANFDEAAALALLNGVDIVHVGGSSLITSSSYLVTLIAAHYRFNPATGKDL